MRSLYKKDASLAFKIIDLMCRKTLNVIHYQFYGKELCAQLTAKTTDLPQKKLMDLILTTPILGEYFDSLDKKDRRNFLSTVQVVEFGFEQSLAIEGQSCRNIIIVLNGELTSFSNGKKGEIHTKGSILGLREFLFDLTWTQNIYGRVKGTVVVLNKDLFQDLGSIFVDTAKTLLNFFVKKEIEKYFVKKPLKFEEEEEFDDYLSTGTKSGFMGLSLKDSGRLKDSSPVFTEIDISKRIERKVDNSKNALEGLGDTFQVFNDVAPLHLHDIHKHIMNEKNRATMGGTQSSEMSSFLLEKIEARNMRDQSKKNDLRMLKIQASGIGNASNQPTLSGSTKFPGKKPMQGTSSNQVNFLEALEKVRNPE